ncbi:unnamed protein product [Rotaria socialis]|uniref:Uncharacterized protein n=1 Tax=Rotaria socialis TaxID=392032 RepID=A0A817RQF5_9BILA|nr:unnamed protein product [Rotaria socialis]CAF3347947.1 unnamed protein product [Rotaria socialis]CAF3352874.1 unnamed protein product [Rotaria socialis]CAF3598997.1 unnamed protein product [Rotaria socialis]CAF4135627.1 unnamed protein product [Rotaria socialis]
MGMINSKSKYITCSNKSDIKCSYRFPTIFHSGSLISLRNRKLKYIDFEFYNRQRFCMKKKVLILGLDGVGKTDLFNRLICPTNQLPKLHSLSQPTVGYNVETIKVYSRHFYLRRCHKITIWDCGGQPSLRSLWPYHFSNTSLLLWLINAHDRSRLDINLDLLSQTLKNRLLDRVPVLIVVYQTSVVLQNQKKIFNENHNENLLTNLEVAYRFLITLSTYRANTFKWQVISINLNDNSNEDLKRVQQSFKELMEL